MNPLFHTEFSISDSLKNVRKSVLIYETIIEWAFLEQTLRKISMMNKGMRYNESRFTICQGAETLYKK